MINRYMGCMDTYSFQKKEGFAEQVEFLVKCFHRALHSTPDQDTCDCLHELSAPPPLRANTDLFDAVYGVRRTIKS